MNVTVFGGSQPKAGTPTYQQAYDLGKRLAQAGHAVLTGGYIGTMEAVSRGASEAGGHVIGVTCTDIEAWRAVRPNAWVKEERRFDTLQERLDELVCACDAALALPGGPGTLTEVALTWNLMIVHSLPARPLILLGPEWRAFIDSFFILFDEYIPPDQRELLQYAKDNLEAMHLLEKTL